MKRTGVFVCHCGINIGGVVDVGKVVEAIKDYPGVAYATDYKYMCSDPGQNLIREAIEKEKLDTVVVAACSPTLHESTFRRVSESSGVNPYLCEIANIREHCSWVHEDGDKATEKAIQIVKTIIEKVQTDEALEPIEIGVTKKAMVIGGGVAGIQSALDIADAGIDVVLVEKSPSIGGHMAQLSETFPTLDCSQCILTPKMVDVRTHPKIRLMAYSEVQDIGGYVGNFKVTVNKKSRYIDEDICNGCGDCEQVCPVSVPSEFDRGLSARKAVYRPSPQAVPNIYTISKREGTAACKAACPAGVNAQGYVALISMGKFQEALNLEREANPFPSVCGRVCTHPCESECKRSNVDQPVAIASLKRFIADRELEAGRTLPKPVEKTHEEKIAIVGSGPAGLTCAYFMARKGYPVTVFEALEKLGGMLYTCVPTFRLPPEMIQADIDYILAQGVEAKTNTRIGQDLSLEDLKSQGYKAIFLGTGAYKSVMLKVPGEDLKGVVSCIDFLMDVNLGKKPWVGKKVAVIGGGNAAIDSARTALRMGAEEVTIVYRRSRKEMPANDWEVEEAEREGIKIHFLATPVKFVGEGGKVKSMECLKMKLGEPDASGRRRPVPIEGSEFIVEADMVIPAVSQTPDTSYIPESIGIKLSKWESVEIDPETMVTDVPGIFAGGDCVTGPATVIEAVAAGKKAACSIERYLNGEELKAETKAAPPKIAEFEPGELEDIEPHERIEMPKTEIAKRKTFEEVELGYTEEMAIEEAKRCLNCGLCSECGECERICEKDAVDHSIRDETEEIEVGAIVVATGYDTLPLEKIPEYGYGKYPDVIDGLQFERILSASGPTAGEVKRPSDGKVPKDVVFIKCVGSRDEAKGIPYCSKICCMYTAKHAMLYKHRVPDGQAYVFYMDIRAGGKGYEEFVRRAAEEDEVLYLRGRVSRVYPQDGKLIVEGADTLTGTQVKVPADLVVLASAVIPSLGAEELAAKIGMCLGEDGFFNEAHPKLRPVETLTSGIFLAGACQAPKDIPEAVAQASGAASKAIGLLSSGKLYHEPIVVSVDEDICCGCKICIGVCPYNAREFDEEKKIAKVIEVMCMGCGACAAACPSGASEQNNFKDDQIFSMVTATMKEE
jgi:heterodisulfide reductase subunit A